MAWRLLLAWAVARVASDCPANTVTVRVGGNQVELQTPHLQEGGSWANDCGALRTGFVGTVQFFCMASVLSGGSQACRPAGCVAGQGGVARIGDGAKLFFPKITRDLEHNREQYVSCSSLEDGYLGYVHLKCSLGDLSADAARCQPALGGGGSAIRIVNNLYLPGNWRVYELAVFSSTDCSTGRLQGEVFAASEDAGDGRTVALAVDNNRSTFWGSWCPEGCQPKTAWLAMAFPSATSVRCVKLQQSQVPCCRSSAVRLELWDGIRWQKLQDWDITGVPSVLGTSLIVPLSCTDGKPTGAGVQHDCDGPPEVGLQRGQTCTARCAEGYDGESQKYVCGDEGRFTGVPPQCVNTDEISQLSSLSLIALVLLGLGLTYQ